MARRWSCGDLPAQSLRLALVREHLSKPVVWLIIAYFLLGVFVVAPGGLLESRRADREQIADNLRALQYLCDTTTAISSVMHSLADVQRLALADTTLPEGLRNRAAARLKIYVDASDVLDASEACQAIKEGKEGS